MTRDARALPEEDGFPNGDELQRLGVGGWGRGAWRWVGVRRRKSEDERGEGVELIRADPQPRGNAGLRIAALAASWTESKRPSAPYGKSSVALSRLGVFRRTSMVWPALLVI